MTVPIRQADSSQYPSAPVAVIVRRDQHVTLATHWLVLNLTLLLVCVHTGRKLMVIIG